MKSPNPLLGAAAALLLSTTPAFSLGFRLADQNAESTARGLAFAATADNPSAVYYNPAGITRLQILHSKFGDIGGRNPGFRPGPLRLLIRSIRAVP